MREAGALGVYAEWKCVRLCRCRRDDRFIPRDLCASPVVDETARGKDDLSLERIVERYARILSTLIHLQSECSIAKYERNNTEADTDREDGSPIESPLDATFELPRIKLRKVRRIEENLVWGDLADTLRAAKENAKKNNGKELIIMIGQISLSSL